MEVLDLLQNLEFGSNFERDRIKLLLESLISFACEDNASENMSCAIDAIVSITGVIDPKFKNIFLLLLDNETNLSTLLATLRDSFDYEGVKNLVGSQNNPASFTTRKHYRIPFESPETPIFVDLILMSQVVRPLNRIRSYAKKFLQFECIMDVTTHSVLDTEIFCWYGSKNLESVSWSLTLWSRIVAMSTLYPHHVEVMCSSLFDLFIPACHNSLSTPPWTIPIPFTIIQSSLTHLNLLFVIQYIHRTIVTSSLSSSSATSNISDFSSLMSTSPTSYDITNGKQQQASGMNTSPSSSSPSQSPYPAKTIHSRDASMSSWPQSPPHSPHHKPSLDSSPVLLKYPLFLYHQLNEIRLILHISHMWLRGGLYSLHAHLVSVLSNTLAKHTMDKPQDSSGDDEEDDIGPNMRNIIPQSCMSHILAMLLSSTEISSLYQLLVFSFVSLYKIDDSGGDDDSIHGNRRGEDASNERDTCMSVGMLLSAFDLLPGGSGAGGDDGNGNSNSNSGTYVMDKDVMPLRDIVYLSHLLSICFKQSHSYGDTAHTKIPRYISRCTALITDSSHHCIYRRLFLEHSLCAMFSNIIRHTFQSLQQSSASMLDVASKEMYLNCFNIFFQLLLSCHLVFASSDGEVPASKLCSREGGIENHRTRRGGKDLQDVMCDGDDNVKLNRNEKRMRSDSCSGSGSDIDGDDDEERGSVADEDTSSVLSSKYDMVHITNSMLCELEHWSESDEYFRFVTKEVVQDIPINFENSCVTTFTSSDRMHSKIDASNDNSNDHHRGADTVTDTIGLGVNRVLVSALSGVLHHLLCDDRSILATILMIIEDPIDNNAVDACSVGKVNTNEMGESDNHNLQANDAVEFQGENAAHKSNIQIRCRGNRGSMHNAVINRIKKIM